MCGMVEGLAAQRLLWGSPLRQAFGLPPPRTGEDGVQSFHAQ
jgi:hypothetical protein